MTRRLALRLRLRDERGIALVMALMVMTVLTIVATSSIFYAQQNDHNSRFSKGKSYAFTMAENGINNAMSVLRSPPDPLSGIGNNSLDPNVFCGLAGYSTGTPPNPNRKYSWNRVSPPTGQIAEIAPAPLPSSPTRAPCVLKDTFDGGYVVWGGWLNSSTATWTVTAVGHVTNPNVNSGELLRTLTVNVAVHPTLTQPLNTPIWNYIYSTKGPSAVPTCDMDLNQSVTIASPLYVEGNLCLHNSSAITKGPLVVKGRLSMDSNLQNYVGTSSVPISDVHVLNGCTVKTTTHTPCKNNGVDNIYATTLDATSPTGLSPPTLNLNNWYLNGSPGPYFPCTTVSGTPPTFDNPVAADPAASDTTKLTYKNNNLTAQDLTPSTSYTCKTAGGELSWNASTKLLTINGTIYVDGSLYVQNGAINTYTGQGVIYLSGTLLIKNSSLCGVIYNGACDTRTYQTSPAQGWDPNTRLICFVANGSGGQVNTNDSIQLVSATLQGAAYASNALELGTTSNVDGPLVGKPVILGQSVTTSFPSITVVPQGMPSNPTAYAQADSPTGYSG